jgi:hypothetical protein
MPLSGRLALESGLRGYEAQLAWARSAVDAYTRALTGNPTITPIKKGELP